MRRWIGQNIGLMLLSFVFAFFFWAWVTEESDPTRQGYLMTIPVELVGLAEDKVAYDIDGDSVRVDLRAPASVWNPLKADDLHAYVDLTDVATGTQMLPIQFETQVKPLQLQELTPAEATLTVEFIAEKALTVTVKSEGTPLFGYQVDTPEVLPQTVRVRGPASWVEKVVQARVTVDVDKQMGAVQSDLAPELLDENENLVLYVETVPKTVTVNVPIWQSDYVRDLAVTLSLVGQPAPGYRVAGVSYDPQVVTVYGRRDIVDAAPSSLQTQIINLHGMTQSLTTTVGLQMPSGLYVISQPRPAVTTTLNIEIIQSGLNLEVAPVILGLAPETTASTEIEKLVLILSGPLAVMEELKAADVQVVLYATGLSPGEYALIPEVTVPKGVTVESVIPEVVSVTIERVVLKDSPMD